MNIIPQAVTWLNDLLWGPPLLFLLVTVGVFLTIALRGVQFRYFFTSHILAFTKHDQKSQGDISHFQSLMTALAGTIGMGSIAGVATAIAVGGLGAIFWMWMTALIGMAIKYAEAILAIKYRIKDENGQMCGGPMYYLERGLKNRPLAISFAVFAILSSFGIGNMVQSNSVAEASYELMGLSPYYVGFFMMILTGVSILWGIKSISKIVSVIVPAMAAFYIIGGLIILAFNIKEIPTALYHIFQTAFTGQAATGGFLGSTMMLAIQMGASRGVFSSEAGMGSSPIAAAAAKTSSPGVQALVSMSSVFITTGIVCTITALVIATTDVLGQIGSNGSLLNGSALALTAFNKALPGGGIIVTIAIIPFAYSTILSWAYYGEKSVEYLFGIKAVRFYRIIFTLFIFPGSLFSLNFVWDFSNLMNGLMSIPNLIGILFLSKVIINETKLLDKTFRC
ncbi:MAG: sodium:alanine symporter family protein [Chlamydiales bacterium]|nr:sodium:alanine symporter family protein [Chlamydiales bacterium]